MADWEKTIIPLSEAEEILSAFGIDSSSRGYQRWRRDDGFRWVDFEDVLNESPFVLNVDWREWLQDAVDTMSEQLGSLGLSVSADLGEEGEKGELLIDGKSARIKYIPNDEDDFDGVVAAVNQVIAPMARYRKFRSSEGSDGWCYAVLKTEDWSALASKAGNTLELLFTEAGASGRGSSRRR